MENKIETYEILGVPISVVNPTIAFDRIVEWSNDQRGRYVGVREVASLMAMHQDPYLQEISRNAAMNIPDGMPLVWIGKRRGYPVERTCGPDLLEKTVIDGQSIGLKHFFYGGKEGVADKLVKELLKKAPNMRVVGTHCPPFRPLTDEENAAIIKTIKTSEADIVWVGISSPKQDVWMFENYQKTEATLIGVGAAFDFHSGEVKRAPKWMQNSGLEFLHRLLSEPRRLWKRYLILAPKFIIKTLTTPKP